LVIATYNRPESLRLCVKFALAQSRPPSEIVIVDASDNWEEHRSLVLNDVAARTTIPCLYESARVRSSTAQRNQAISLATGDILFLIDDDSFMHPSCADEVMKIYDLDTQERVAGVAPLASYLTPEHSEQGDQIESDNTEAPSVWSIARQINRLVEREFYIERFCLPYDNAYPDHPIPAELAGSAVSTARYFNGFRMTFRASVISKVGFDETLTRYAAGEDIDTSYRASRHGVLLNATNARIFHAQDARARLSLHTITLLGLMNLAYLYRRNGNDPARLLGSYRWRIVRRAMIDIVRDLVRLRFSLPCARADLEALFRLHQFRRIPLTKIPDWYTALQIKIVERNAA
jgi:GT2 family glycosyltransferase